MIKGIMMKRLVLILLITVGTLSAVETHAQRPADDFGFGIILGEPTGITLKFWSNNENAFVLDVGGSYFGSLSIVGDYLWHFDAFNSNIVGLYAGPGAVIGFGEGNEWIYKRRDDDFYHRDDDDIGIGARGVFGVNIVPRRTPLEIFAEIGVMVGLIPGFGTGAQAAIGVRFYP